MARDLSWMAARALAVLLGSGALMGAGGGVEIFDDFQDGDFADGCPATWEMIPGAIPGAAAPAGGDVVLEGQAFLAAGDIFSGDVTARIQGTFRSLESEQEAYLSVVVHGDARTSRGYRGSLSSKGSVHLERREDGDVEAWHRSDIIAGFSPEDDWVLQLDVLDAESGSPKLEARAWRAGECPPADATLVEYEGVSPPFLSGRASFGFRDGLSERDVGQGIVRYAGVRKGEGEFLSACTPPASLLPPCTCDDFEDGGVLDSRPICWQEYPLTPAAFDVLDGGLRIRNTQSNGYGALQACEPYRGNISVRALARIDEPEGVLNSEVNLLISGTELYATYALEFASSGRLRLVLFDRAGRRDAAIAMTGIDTSEFFFLQIDLVGRMVEARAWRPDRPMPIEPTLPPFEDIQFREGSIFIGAYSNPPSPDFHGVFESVCISKPTFLDCNGNGSQDASEIAAGASEDCNANAIPDECDIASGMSEDCNGNTVLDECDIASGTSEDSNGNGAPDDCDLASGRSYDCNEDGALDDSQISPFPATLAENTTGIPDEVFLGPPDWVDGGLGNASVTYDFRPASVVDGPGPDLIIYDGFEGVDGFYSIDVLVSEDGLSFATVRHTEATLVIRIPGDEAAAGALAHSYDIEPSGLAAARYIKIQGIVDLPPGEGRGFDLDAVGAIHLEVCDPIPREFRRGDANADDRIDLSDPISILSSLFLGTGALPCLDAGDTNDDGAIDISDGVYLLSFLFTGGKPPPSPHPGCGADPTHADGLSCESFPCP